MPTWAKIVIAVWLYLSIGYGILLFNQIMAHKYPKSELFVVIDPDDEDDMGPATATVIVWPVVLLCAIICAFVMIIKYSLKIVDNELKKENKGE